MSRPDYRPFLPTPAQSKIAGPTARAHAEARRQNPRFKVFSAERAAKLAEPFKGITTDGDVVPGLYGLEPNGAPVAAMTNAAKALLGRLTAEQRAASCFPVDSDAWRRWQNTEMYLEDYGLRLEEISEAQRDAVLAVLRVSLSGKGYQMSQRDVMRLSTVSSSAISSVSPAVLGEGGALTFAFSARRRRASPGAGRLFGHHFKPQLHGDRRADGSY